MFSRFDYQVLRKLKETPCIAPMLDEPEWIAGVWSDAVTLAITETGLETFPDACPWNAESVPEAEWLPPS